MKQTLLTLSLSSLLSASQIQSAIQGQLPQDYSPAVDETLCEKDKEILERYRLGDEEY